MASGGRASATSREPRSPCLRGCERPPLAMTSDKSRKPTAPMPDIASREPFWFSRQASGNSDVAMRCFMELTYPETILIAMRNARFRRHTNESGASQTDGCVFGAVNILGRCHFQGHMSI